MKSKRNLSFIALVIVLSVATLFAMTACGANPLQDAVDEINSNREMHEDLEGLYKVHAEVRERSTIVVSFRAEIEELATPEVSQIVSDEAASEFQAAVREMHKAGVSDAAIVLEFSDTDGNLIFTREFS